MNFLTRREAIAKINEFARNRAPFLFVIDFSTGRSVVLTPPEAALLGIRYAFGEPGNQDKISKPFPPFLFEPDPVPFTIYHQAFDRVMGHLKRGDSYLLNLTFPTTISTRLTLEEIYQHAKAPFRLYFAGKFIVFSPERFVLIRDGKIFSNPMKGTIDAAIPEAEKQILGDDKEFFEHNTIVDLIRNDLSMVASAVCVKRFRYIDRIVTNKQTLLQVSSEICGTLPAGFLNRLGETLFTLLPAGSVTGAPKTRTVQIIRQTEQDDRGFYTGIFGYFNGKDLDSAVMIRFIESANGTLRFRSGGGITARSRAENEYQELIQKVYVPVI